MTEETAFSLDSITIQQTVIILIAATIISLLIALLPNLKYMLRKQTNGPNKIALGIGGTALALSLGAAIYLGILVNTAVDHGLYATNLPVAPLQEQINLSPIDQSEEFGTYVDENGTPTNTIVSMYRFSCRDCEGVYEELDARLRAMPYKYFWVSSRSPVGMQLRDLYDVTQVPAIISFDAKGRASVSLVQSNDAAGNIKLDNAAMDIIEHTLQTQADAEQITANTSSDEKSKETSAEQTTSSEETNTNTTQTSDASPTENNETSTPNNNSDTQSENMEVTTN